MLTNERLEVLSKFTEWYMSVNGRPGFEALVEIYRGARSDEEAARLMAEGVARRHPEIEQECGIRVDDIMWISIVRAVKRMVIARDTGSEGQA